MAEKMMVIIKKPGMDAYPAEIPNTLEALQEAVGGYIETMQIGTDLVAVFDVKGRIKGRKENSFGFFGPIVFAGKAGNEFCSVSEDAVQMLCRTGSQAAVNAARDRMKREEDRHGQIMDQVRMITSSHPLRESEQEYLAFSVEAYRDGSANAIREMKTVLSFLEFTGRISPRERNDLLGLAAFWKEAKEDPEEKFPPDPPLKTQAGR